MAIRRQKSGLTIPERNLLRAFITSHGEWPAYRAETGISSAALTSAACLAYCNRYGIEPRAAIESRRAQSRDDMAPAQSRDDTAPAPAAPADFFKAPGTPAPGTPAPANKDAAQALAHALSLLQTQADPAQIQGMIDAAVEPLRAAIAQIQAPAPIVVTVDQDGAQIGDLPATRHPMAETLLRAVTARDAAGYRLNVWLAGPTGSGKTHAARQIAAALDLEFGFHGSMSMAHELLGFVDAGGRYHETVFARLFQHGGVCLLDEIDAGSDEARLAINAGLANGLLALPDGRMVERHADFICIGAANTWGSGATADYVGRAKIDAATLSRFPVKLAWQYDNATEAAISGNPDFAAMVQAARAKASAAGLKHPIDPRHSIAGAALIAAGFGAGEAARMTYLAGLTDAQIAMVQS